MSDYLKTYFHRLENGIRQLPEKERAKVYRDCGQTCVKDGVWQAQQQLFEKCSGNLDAMYARMSELGEISGKVICSGSEYEITFPASALYMSKGFCFQPVIVNVHGKASSMC
jgi:hypothetical protein